MQEVMSYYSYADYMEGRKSNSYDSVAVRYDLETEYIPISTASEPLLNPLSDIDDDFDFSSDFYSSSMSSMMRQSMARLTHFV